MSDQQPQYVVVRSPKSVGIGLILTFFFGPIGLFYASIFGGIVMLIFSVIFNFITGLVTFGYGLAITVPVTYLICMIWAYLKIKSYNKNLMAGAMRI